jgi:hypothetical protein
MADQAGQDVVGVLPHRLGDDDRQVRVRLGEDFEALLLAAPHPLESPRTPRFLHDWARRRRAARTPAGSGVLRGWASATPTALPSWIDAVG